MATENNSNYEDWKLNFPDGTLNEYYAWLRKKGNTDFLITKPLRETEIFNNIPTNVKETNETNYYFLAIGIFACIIGFVGFFTPWLTLPIPVLKISISGNEINQLANYVNNNYDVGINGKTVTYIKYIYSLPITIVLILISYLIKNNLLITIFTILYLVFFTIFFHYFLNTLDNLFTLLNYGFYLTALSVVITLFNLFNLK